MPLLKKLGCIPFASVELYSFVEAGLLNKTLKNKYIKMLSKHQSKRWQETEWAKES